MAGTNLGGRAPLPVRGKQPLVRTRVLATLTARQRYQRSRWRHKWLSALAYDYHDVGPPIVYPAVKIEHDKWLVAAWKQQHTITGVVVLRPPVVVGAPVVVQPVFSGPEVTIVRNPRPVAYPRIVYPVVAGEAVAAVVFPGIRRSLVYYRRRPQAFPRFVYPIVVFGAQRAKGGPMVIYVRRPQPKTIAFLRRPVVVN